ncbi:hypothetical protein COY07_05160 [Candidatus Peregrinibacteria bacterium CG_4_10_14_0_2_um_filter_43_11]|nr:MAG: hypothetical protein COY07_05160 [Candidatus Peregrinibacteria bacterium CG_4_10_14_0_2_um_filter_43_11]
MLKEQIIADLTAAMKARDELTLSTLRMLKAEIMKYEVSGADKVVTDEIVIDLVKKGIKQRREAAEGFEKGGNLTAKDKELAEITILEKYMPQQMGEDQVKAIVQEVVTEMNATTADFGKVMGAAMGKLKGRADGNVVSKVVKEVLT